MTKQERETRVNIYTEQFSTGWDGGYYVIAEVGEEVEVGLVLKWGGPAVAAEYMAEWCERVVRMVQAAATPKAAKGGEGGTS